jgi:hypothetical protein
MAQNLNSRAFFRKSDPISTVYLSNINAIGWTLFDLVSAISASLSAECVIACFGCFMQKKSRKSGFQGN